MPPIPNTVSTTTTPPGNVPTSMPSWDTTGVSPDRIACWSTTRRSASPFARAVLM